MIERLRLIRRENEQYMYELDRIERETEKLRICNNQWRVRAERGEEEKAVLELEKEALRRDKFRLEQETKELREAIAERCVAGELYVFSVRTFVLRGHMCVCALVDWCFCVVVGYSVFFQVTQFAWEICDL